MWHRKAHTRANGIDSGEAVPTRPRDRRRGWGPFSGGQLTAIIMTLTVVIGFPVAAFAASGSNVFITDSTSHVHASVNSAGELNVAEASPLSFVTGTKNLEAIPTNTWAPLVAPSSSHALVITSIAVDTFSVATPGANQNVDFAVSASDASCAALVTPGGLGVADINPGSVGETVIPFQPGIVVPANRALCVKNTDNVHLGAEAYAYGYRIPAAAAPTANNLTPRSGTPGGTRQTLGR
jgi:hypothetical protein